MFVYILFGVSSENTVIYVAQDCDLSMYHLKYPFTHLLFGIVIAFDDDLSKISVISTSLLFQRQLLIKTGRDLESSNSKMLP